MSILKAPVFQVFVGTRDSMTWYIQPGVGADTDRVIWPFVLAGAQSNTEKGMKPWANPTLDGPFSTHPAPDILVRTGALVGDGVGATVGSLATVGVGAISVAVGSGVGVAVGSGAGTSVGVLVGVGSAGGDPSA